MFTPLNLSRILGLFPLDSQYKFSLKRFSISLIMFSILVYFSDSKLTMSSALYVIISTINTALQNVKLGSQRKFTYFPPTYFLCIFQIIILTLSRRARGLNHIGVCTTVALLKHHELLYLIQSAENPNQIYPLGLQMLAYCLRMFFTLCVMLAELTVSIVRLMYLSEIIPKLLGTMILWILITVTELIITVRVYTSMQRKSERRKILKYKNLIRSGIIKEKDVIKFELYRKIEFTACGLFEINNKLIFEIITGACSILVIFLQFTLENTCPKPEVL